MAAASGWNDTRSCMDMAIYFHVLRHNNSGQRRLSVDTLRFLFSVKSRARESSYVKLSVSNRRYIRLFG